MRDDRTTLEMFKEVVFKAPWPLVERVTHLFLAVMVGYRIAKCETDEQKLDSIARHQVEKKLQDPEFKSRVQKRVQEMQARKKDALPSKD